MRRLAAIASTPPGTRAAYWSGLEQRREEALVGVAVRQDEPADALGVVRRDELGDRAAGVVAHQQHVVEALEQAGDEPGQAGRREVLPGTGVVCEPSGSVGVTASISSPSAGTTLRHSV